MSNQQGYYRHPTIHGETIVFVTEDDLWSVPATGGTARRLTATPGACLFPVLSPDGSRVAFSGRDEGPLEIYVMSTAGGPATRLTWLGGASIALGWSPDGSEILFSSDWRRPFMKEQMLAAVPASGGPVRELKLGPARAISFEPAGDGQVIGRNSGDPARWKRYKGGTAGTIWIDRAGNGNFAELIKLAGNLANPLWIGPRIYFLSDHEGHGNLYSCTPAGRDLRRHTHHEDFFVRYPASDGRRIVYHAGADLFVFDPATGQEDRVEISLSSPRAQRARRFVSPSRFFESFSLHPKGHSLVSVHRGGVYTLGLWEGAPGRLGRTDGPRYRLATWLPDGKHIVAVSDETGEESLVVLRAADDGAADRPGVGRATRRAAARPKGRAPRSRGGQVEAGTLIQGVVRRIDGDFGRAITLAAARHGANRVALTNHRQEVILVDLTTGRHRVIERSQHNRIAGLAWSADGRWIAYGFGDGPRTTSIHLCEAATGKVTPVTRSEFNDAMPVFDPEGRYLYFISYRVFDPIYDSQYFDLGFPRGSRPYLVTLKKTAVSPFALGTRPPRAPGAPAQDPNGSPEKKDEAKEPPRVEIDLDGIADRVVAFPVPEGIYVGLEAARNRIFLATVPAEGSLDANIFSTEPAARSTLSAWNLDEDKLEPIADRVTDFQLSLDTKVVAIRSGNRLRVLPASHKSEGKPVKDEPGRESGWVDLERLRVPVIPSQEWTQMFREIWRLQRDQFWTPDMSGLDWVEVYNRYRPLVDRCGTRAEFSDLVWELQGELGTSHCYEVGGDYRPGPAWMQGFLGADLDWDARRRAWRISRVPRGDSWDPKWSSPLAAPGMEVHVGDEIVAVDGQPVGAEVSPYERLANQAGRDVQITLRSAVGSPARGARRGASAAKDGGGALRTIVVRTLNQEFNLRYRDWVERNRAWVHQVSDGRVGYVHVPNMGPWGYAEFHRYFLSEVNRPGLLVDVRYNGGGHVSQLILEKLLRKRIGYDANRWSEPTPYPMDAPMGPMAALTNEYAGSDGDIFSHCFKLTGLGPLIGKRTWGGVVGIWPRHVLVDGSLTTQPEFAFWFQDVAWGVENYGTDPDIEVDIRPQDWHAGLDPQLSRGVTEVEKLIRRMKPKVPEMKNRPKLKPGRLPRVK